MDVPNRGRGVLFVSIILFHQLDDKNALAVRLGGLYALERIARDSAQDRATIAEVLCAYARTAKREERPARPAPARPAKDPTRPAAHTRLPPELPAEPASLRVRAPDIQAVLTILGLWRERLQEPPPVLDLHDAELQGAYLVGAELQDANLVGAQLQDAKLEHSKLHRANLTNAELQGARLGFAELQGASLERANLQDADRDYANLEGTLLLDANLQGAKLSFARLQGALATRETQWPDAEPGGPRPLKEGGLRKAGVMIVTKMMPRKADVRSPEEPAPPGEK